MSRNLKGTPSYSMRDADRGRPRGGVTLSREAWAALRAEAERRGVALGRVVEEALEAHLTALGADQKNRPAAPK